MPRRIYWSVIQIVTQKSRTRLSGGSAAPKSPGNLPNYWALPRRPPTAAISQWRCTPVVSARRLKIRGGQKRLETPMTQNPGPSLAPAHSWSGDPIMGLRQPFGTGSTASWPKSRGPVFKHEFSGILSTWHGVIFFVLFCYYHRYMYSCSIFLKYV